MENHGFVLGPISIKPVNQQDTIILPETLTTLVDFTRRMGIDLRGSALTLDAGFDSKDNKDAIKALTFRWASLTSPLESVTRNNHVYIRRFPLDAGGGRCVSTPQTAQPPPRS